MRRADLRSETGSVLVIAIILMSLMFTVAVASLRIVETQQQRALEQRQRESSFNLAEAVLLSQGFVLAGAWPGNLASATTTPTMCTSATVSAMCPNPNTLAAAGAAPSAANFTNVDAAGGSSWTTRTRDNGGSL